MNTAVFMYNHEVTRAILESSLDAAFTIDAHGHIVDVNTPATRLFGWSQAEFLAQNIACIVAPPHGQRHDGYLAAFNPHQGVSHILGNGQVLMAQRNDGTQFPVEVGISSFMRDGQRYFTGFVRDMTERQAHQDRLAHLATHDDDTGLLNFRGLQTLAAKHAEWADHTCLCVQLEGFSRAVAAHGRQAGWHILQFVSQRLRPLAMTVADGTPALARVGEASFVLFTRTDPMAHAQAIRAVVCEPIPYSGVVLQVVGRVGMSAAHGTLEARYRQSMTACEHVDRTCGGILAFVGSLQDRLQRELHMAARLRHALADGALRLVLQPKLDLRTRRVVGAEALVRWVDAELGAVSPAEFIPVAERTGQIGAITDWVLRQSLDAIRPHAPNGLTVAVNFSAIDFQQPGVAQQVQGALARAQVASSVLVLELTESALAEDPHATAARMTELRALGVRLSLDDFGTGYSSMSYLRQFPLDSLKIDASFVRHTPADADANAIATAIAALAKALGLVTVAEGVETPEQADFLTSLNVDQCQGFWFARPLAVADFNRFVQTHT